MKTRYIAKALFVSFIMAGLMACGGPIIISSYGSMMGANGRLRQAPHTGIDFSEMRGAQVLAAAEGQVIRISNGNVGCGRGVLIAHSKFQRYTAYCHLEKVLIHPGQEVKRGEVIGLVGTTGNAVGVPHVHFELLVWPRMGSADGNFQGTEDPLEISMGCFENSKIYPTDRLALTHPVQCVNPRMEGRQ